jgi:hypothetical protein
MDGGSGFDTCHPGTGQTLKRIKRCEVINR